MKQADIEIINGVDRHTVAARLDGLRLLGAACAAAALGLVAVFSVVGPGGPLFSVGGAHAQNAPKTVAVVELFTSQGCSSCPPADKLLKTYVERSDVVALSFPIDYWDYLGWPDTFATPMNTERQRAYARTRRDGAVYTPQAVVNGGAHFVGFHKDKIDASIGESVARSGGAAQVPLRFFKDGSDYVVETGPAATEISASQMMFWIVAVQSRGTVKIQDGENRGKELTYYNVVRGLTPIGSWDGKPKTIRIAKSSFEKPNADSYLVLLQKGTSGMICGAAWLSAQ